MNFKYFKPKTIINYSTKIFHNIIIFHHSNRIHLNHELNNIFTPHAKLVDAGTLDICFISSKNISYWESKLTKFNIKIIEGPVNRIGATSNLLSIYFNDPDGNLIEISNVVQKK